MTIWSGQFQLEHDKLLEKIGFQKWKVDMKQRKILSMLSKILHLFFQFESNDDFKVNFRSGLTGLEYYYRNLRAWKPSLFKLGILRVFTDLFIPVFSLLLPTLVVKGIVNQWSVERFLFIIGSVILSLLICNLIHARITITISEQKDVIRNQYIVQLCKKQMEVDYDVLISPQFMRLKNLAFHWIVEWSNGPMEHCISSPGAIIACLIGMLVYGYLLIQLNAWLLVFIILSVFVSIAMSARALRYEDAMWGKSASSRSKMWYIHNRVTSFEEGKDIRLFGMQGWFLSMYRTFLSSVESYYDEVQWKYFGRSATDVAMIFVRDVVAYVYIIIKIVGGELTVTDAVLYTTLVAGFSNWFNRSIDELQWIIRGGFAFFSIKSCLEAESPWSDATHFESEKTRQEGAVLIELRDVTFTYDNNKEPILSHINLIIRPGEKLALVGLNGAGKTTLVKLLCGFYHPTEGEILVNGKRIFDYDIDEYYGMISAVFQDADLLPVSICENISNKGLEVTDVSKVLKCIQLSGLEEKVNSLKNKENTVLVRELSHDAIELSGGERQKLLLARALYKDSPFIILDEPTAALDPIAENDIYMKYGELTKGRTSLFISHRLSSTRFCDRIILLEHGGVLEEGTHESLMKLNGRYAEIYKIQSQYYIEKEETLIGGDELYEG